MIALPRALRSRSLRILWDKLLPAGVWERRPSLNFCLCAFTVIASLLLGGGTRGGFLSDVILELFAIPAFLVSLSSLVAVPWAERKRRTGWVLMFCLAIALVPLVQLVPLPPWIWTRLPNREETVAVFDLLARQRPWLPISVSPSSTWLSLLSLLPPFAIFLGVIQIGYRERRLLSLTFLGVGILAAFVGLVQVAQGPLSPLRFYIMTNESEAVGFFANRNHFAALLYALVLFAAAWATDVAFKSGSWDNRRNLETMSIAALTASFLVIVVFIAGEAITRSRAGLGLMIVALAGAFALPVADRRRSSGVTPVKLLFGSTILAITLAVQFALYRILERFAADPLADARLPFARNTIAAAKAYLPFGSGVGTFVFVYPTFEPPQDLLANTFANHAHNDFLEVWLEGGIAAIVLALIFAIWFVWRSAEIWWRPATNARAIDHLLARAATIVIALFVVHSFVDYPLRTGAIMAVFAFSCALLIEPLSAAPEELKVMPNTTQERIDEYVPRATAPQAPPAAKAADATPEKPTPHSPERWGENIDWPDQWRK